MNTILEKNYEKTNLINKIIDNLVSFIINDEDTKNDYKEYVKTIGSDAITAAIPYIFERRFDAKSIFDIYLSKSKSLPENEIQIINSLAENFTSVFELKKKSIQFLT